MAHKNQEKKKKFSHIIIMKENIWIIVWDW
jgi:hypothetical protein